MVTMDLTNKTYLKTIIQIEGQEYSEALTKVDGITWVSLLDTFLRQHLLGAGFNIPVEDLDEIMDFVEEQSKDNLDRILREAIRRQCEEN